MDRVGSGPLDPETDMRTSPTLLMLGLLGACAAPVTDSAPEAASGAAPFAERAALASDAEIDASIAAPLYEYSASMGWNTPAAPFTIAGNLHYVGTEAISAFLIKTPDGHILIDGIVPQSAPQILQNIKTPGFGPSDVKYLLNSHAHVDHAGGLAALKRATGAVMVASAADKPILEAGDVFTARPKA